ncbi:MAG: hypothetical protein KME64_17220 [Scytonematopsis contorta HA4267-MV1]|nr:hypothetical protein [Scytonematopsis contorta HA4267-MV1]
MNNQNQEFNQAQNLALTDKYTQLNKYKELSDIELSIVAGGGGSAMTCASAADCPPSGVFLPETIETIFTKTAAV